MNSDDIARFYRERSIAVLNKLTANMSMVTHHVADSVVTWRDNYGYHNAAIDWQFQKNFKRMKSNYPVPATLSNAFVASGEFMLFEAMLDHAVKYGETVVMPAL